MKRTFLTVTVLISAMLTLTACGSNNQTVTPTAATTASATPVATPTPTVIKSSVKAGTVLGQSTLKTTGTKTVTVDLPTQSVSVIVTCGGSVDTIAKVTATLPNNVVFKNQMKCTGRAVNMLAIPPAAVKNVKVTYTISGTNPTASSLKIVAD